MHEWEMWGRLRSEGDTFWQQMSETGRRRKLSELCDRETTESCEDGNQSVGLRPGALNDSASQHQ